MSQYYPSKKAVFLVKSLQNWDYDNFDYDYDTSKLLPCFLKQLLKTQKKLKEWEIMYQNPIYTCISWCSKICRFPVKICWCQQNSRDVSSDLYIFWIFFGYNCSIAVQGFIIVGYVCPHPWAAPKKPILNRFNVFVLCVSVMYLFCNVFVL